jgi:hypothetical protein
VLSPCRPPRRDAGGWLRNSSIASMNVCRALLPIGSPASTSSQHVDQTIKTLGNGRLQFIRSRSSSGNASRVRGSWRYQVRAKSMAASGPGRASPTSNEKVIVPLAMSSPKMWIAQSENASCKARSASPRPSPTAPTLHDKNLPHTDRSRCRSCSISQ